MSLLARKRIWWIVSIIFLVWGCQEDLGIEVTQEEALVGSSEVEFTLPVSNMYIDSLRTDKTGEVLVGQYTSSATGTVSAEAYFEYIYKSGEFVDYLYISRIDTVEDVTYLDSIGNFRLDRVELVLDINEVVTDDPSITMDLEVYSLLDSIYSEAIYMSDRSISAETDVVGSYSLEVTTDSLLSAEFKTEKTPVTIPLDDEIGNMLIVDYDSLEIAPRELGFSLQSPSSNGIMSFNMLSDTTELLVYMKGDMYDTATLTIKKDTTIALMRFSLATNNHFTHLDRDLSGSVFSGLSDGEVVDVGDKAYYHQIAGIHPVIDLTPFREFAATEEQFLSNRGEFEILVETNDGLVPLVETTQFYFGKPTDDNTLEVNWPGVLGEDIYSSAIVTDLSYRTNYQSSSLLTLVNDTIVASPLTFAISAESVALWQYLYENEQDQLNAVPEDEQKFPSYYLTDKNQAVMYSPRRIHPGFSVIPEDGVQVKIIYTKLNE